MKQVLITGANGFLGQHLTLFLATEQFKVTATGRGNCRIDEKKGYEYLSVDLTDESAIQNMVAQLQPSIIIHNAAMSKPDECENDKPACILNNVTATEYMVKAANNIGAKLIYISTDFIFGENGPHEIDAIPNPLNFYGKSKLMAEELVKNTANNYAIVRPVFIYGPTLQGIRPSFLHWVKNNVEAGKTIKVVSDQLRMPTFVTDICKGLQTIVLDDKQGVYHLAGKDILSPYEMAIAVADLLGLDKKLIISVTAATFAEPVVRAKKSGLKIDKSIQELNYQPVSFNEGVMLTFK
jgi:dTDP-4-dehydrorhamnose reductase